MDITKIGDSLMKQFQEEIFLILQTDTPDAVKGKWRQRRGKIELDRQLNPEAHAALDLREQGGIQTVTEEVVKPSFVSKFIPQRIRAYRRRGKTGGVEQVRQHSRQREQPSLEDQLTPVEEERDVMVFKQPILDDLIHVAIVNVLNRNKVM